MLEVLGYVNTFVSFFFLYSFTFRLNRSGITFHIVFRTGYILLYFVTCLFTYVCNDKEIRWQRIVAIVLNIATMLYLGLYVVVAYTYVNDKSYHNQ